MRRLLLALLLAPSPALAQPPAPDRVERDVARRVAERVAAAVEESYVSPDTGRLIASLVRERASAGAYDVPMGAAQLADRLGADLKRVNGDLHLYVNFVGAQRGDAPRGPQVVMRRPGDPVPQDQLLQARRWNHYIRSAERRAGNVGYLSIAQLSARSDEAHRVVDAAMAFLERTDAMVIDLRWTPGGNPQMADYVASYFLPDSARTLSSYMRATGETRERRTVPVNGRKRPDVPVYVLVGPGTASAAEDLAFIFKQTKRGTLVGERTAGAGRLTRLIPVGDGFMVSVSGGRTFDPRTGAEWERVGVQPDIAAPAEDALVAAHADALATLEPATSDSVWARSLAWARRGVLARARPHPVALAVLRQYAGTYDARIISFEDGKLWYQREANRAKEELTPIDDRTFALGEASRIEFLREGGRVTGLRLSVTPELGSVFPRTG